MILFVQLAAGAIVRSTPPIPRRRTRPVQITRYSDYAFRVLIFLAVDPDHLATIEEIAQRHGISKAHLMKVVHALSADGYVETVRGRNGGLRLARPPEQIRVGDVIRSTEANLALVECFAPASGCRIEPACGLRPLLGEALDAFFAVLDRNTVADLVARRRKSLERLLAS
jgi:Rrf2 family nitric oxide-sensitive transcriptional repressor